MHRLIIIKNIEWIRDFCFFLTILITCNSCASFISAMNAPYYTYDQRLKMYFDESKLDPIEGLYTITDKIQFDYPLYYLLSNDKTETVQNWAKVAIIKDSTSIKRNYIVRIIEAEGYTEAFLFGEILEMQQNGSILRITQHTTSNEKTSNALFEFVPEEGRISGELKENDFSAALTIERTYWKYYPK